VGLEKWYKATKFIVCLGLGSGVGHKTLHMVPWVMVDHHVSAEVLNNKLLEAHITISSY
jgi:hypothetical protein